MFLVFTWICYISYRTGMQDCWSRNYCLSWTLGLSLKCAQFKSFFIGVILVDVNLNWLNWLSFLNLVRGPLIIDILYDFPVFNSFFIRTARLWQSLQECFPCFPLTYNLNLFKFPVNRHLLSLGFLQTAFLLLFIFFSSFFLQLHATHWLFNLVSRKFK